MIHSKLNTLRNKIRRVKATKTSQGVKFSYKYTPLDDILDAVQPILSEFNLCYLHRIGAVGMGISIVDTETGESEDFGEIPFSFLGISDPQKIGGAITFFRRYSLCMALGIVADEDDDAQALANSPTIIDRINSATTPDELAQIGKTIKTASVPENVVKAYNAKKSSFSNNITQP